ncbi:hypothetical protein [uncultured Clostridium sp.]|uniref:hypothetical protein n=1 Tax=uncultured Clostridium sp. TaxID=59620 RepID=UPI0025E31C62|nr:hypothetical protein [uncultured Clostridium sp.]
MVTKSVSSSLLKSGYIVNEGVSSDLELISKFKSFFNRVVSNIEKDIKTFSFKNVYFYNDNSNIEICKNTILRQDSIL